MATAWARLLLVACLVCVLAAPGHARAGEPGVTGAAPNPIEPARLRPGCSGTVSDSRLAVSLDATTLWRPRGSEVRFVFAGGDAKLAITSISVTFGWSEGPAAAQATEFYDCQPAPLVRAIPNDQGQIEFGATVPGLPPVPTAWPMRWIGQRDPVAFSGLYIVPVALMTVDAKATLGDGTTVHSVTVLPVGVTSVPYAVVLALASLLGIGGFAYVVLRKLGWPAEETPLGLITGRDGYASLSQLQILLWTVVVGISAIYVMTLSGNLIDITGGTLTLLGVAGGATLLARAADARTARAKLAALQGDTKAAQDKLAAAQDAADKAEAAEKPAAACRLAAAEEQAKAAVQARDTALSPPPRTPFWADLVVVDAEQGIDVTRLQMLIFTCISAAFVALKVIVDYRIPEIPDGYVILMGISNGVYIAGKQIPDPASTGKAGS